MTELDSARPTETTDPKAQGVLGKATVERLLSGSSPLVERLRDREAQVQPHGVDLTVEALWRFLGAGALGPERRLPERERVPPQDGWYRLQPGTYLVTIHEYLHLPPDLMALAFPRSSLLRCGARLGTAVIDAGYYGQPEALLFVENPFGLDLAESSAICQVVFFPLNETVPGYAGAYQGQFFTKDAADIAPEVDQTRA